MNNADLLNVWYEDRTVGQLWRDDVGNIGFKYEESWVNKGFAISQQLPLTLDEYAPTEGLAHKFFANLLPEAGARIHIVRDLKISNSDFELLKAIGGECAGALSILPTEYKSDLKQNYKKLSNEELKKIILRKGNISSFTSEEERPRLSLAGVQDKCPIFYDGKDYFLPQGSATSTHILKFELTDYKNIPVYEYFLNKLANTIDLPTVESELKKCDREHYLLIKRYDRIKTADKKVKRLHQEDFCQALGVGYDRKYQADGGPSFADVYKLIQQVSINSIVDSENLLKWQIFNLLAGNSDGHVKNLALIYNEQDQVTLAPFYDLVCTRAVDRIDTKLALSIGSEFNPGNITFNHWVELSHECNIREQYIKKLLHEIAETLLDSVKVTVQQFEADHGPYPALQIIEQVVTKQCTRALKQLS